MMKRFFILTLCLVFLVSSSVIPSSAEQECPGGEHVGHLDYFDRIEYYDSPYPTEDNCCSFIQTDRWSCCGAFEYTYGNMSHSFTMTGASHMTCSNCGYERDAK